LIGCSDNGYQQVKAMFKRSLMYSGLIFLLSACTPAKPLLDYSDSFNFSAVRSYAMTARDDMQDSEALISDMTRNRIELAIEAELEAKGFKNAPRDKADVFVAYYVITQERQQVTQTERPVYRCRYCAPAWATDVQVRQYSEGTLIIDVIDSKTDKAVWRGSTAGRINPKAEMEERKEQIRKAVALVLSGFPPQ
jgi:hypothetical protein